MSEKLIIAERVARQLIVVQGSRISASVYLFICLWMCNVRNAGSTSFMHRRTHKANVSLMAWTAIYITSFYGTNDYGFL